MVAPVIAAGARGVATATKSASRAGIRNAQKVPARTNVRGRLGRRNIRRQQMTTDEERRQDYNQRNPLAESVDVKRRKKRVLKDTTPAISNVATRSSTTAPGRVGRILQNSRRKNPQTLSASTHVISTRLLSSILIGAWFTLGLFGWGVQMLGLAATALGNEYFGMIPIAGQKLADLSAAAGVGVSLVGWMLVVLIGSGSILMCHIVRSLQGKASLASLILYSTLYLVPLINIVPWCLVYLWVTRRS